MLLSAGVLRAEGKAEKAEGGGGSQVLDGDLGGVEAQSQRIEQASRVRQRLLGGGLGRGEDTDIIHRAHEAPAARAHAEIPFVEVEVGEQGGEGAAREQAPAADQPTALGIPDRLLHALLNQVHGSPIRARQEFPELAGQDRPIYMVEEVLDVGGNDVCEAGAQGGLNEGPRVLARVPGAGPDGLGQEQALEHRLQDAVEPVMDKLLPLGQAGNEPAILGIRRGVGGFLWNFVEVGGGQG